MILYLYFICDDKIKQEVFNYVCLLVEPDQTLGQYVKNCLNSPVSWQIEQAPTKAVRACILQAERNHKVHPGRGAGVGWRNHEMEAPLALARGAQDS